MIIRQALKKYSSIEIELLLSHILGRPKEFLYMNGEFKLTRIQTNRLTRMANRRLKGEPVAYILGYKDFYGLRFKVDRNVLIPRPETEELINLTISNFAKRSEKSVNHAAMKNRSLAGARDGVKILDIGTGSGCIAIAVAKLVTSDGLRVTASDISSAALKVAKKNAKLILGKKSNSRYYRTFLPIKFVRSDLLANIKDNFDIIIANLPYGWYGVKNRFSSVKEGLKFEPVISLYTKEKGLMQIRRLLLQIAALKNKPKLVYLEFDPRQKSDLYKLIKKHLPKSKTQFHRDFNSLWRYVEIKNLF